MNAPQSTDPASLFLRARVEEVVEHFGSLRIAGRALAFVPLTSSQCWKNCSGIGTFEDDAYWGMND